MRIIYLAVFSCDWLGRKAARKENQSFDSVLGYWCDANRGRCPDGGMPALVRLSDGSVVRPGVLPDTVPIVAHNVWSQLAAMDGGKMDGWQKEWGCAASAGYACIGGYRPWHIPNLSKLAQHFAISDHTFSMGDSPSWGGHLYVAMASLDGFTGDIPVVDTQPGAPRVGQGWGCDSNRITTWRGYAGVLHWVPSCVPDPSLNLPNGGAFEPTLARYAPTIFDRLDQAGLSWRIYGTPKTTTFVPHSEYAWSICPSLAECLYTSQDQNLVPSAQFVTDAAAGNLPAYSVVVPGNSTMGDSCHNGESMTACDNWVGQLVGAVESGADWPSTAVFITFDDCGCFYDQVPPGVNPDGTQQGPRVPMIIVSPYARRGYTDTHPATFASILAFTEHNFGLHALSHNDWYAYDFSGAFDYSRPPLKPAPMVTQPLPESARHINVARVLAGQVT